MIPPKWAGRILGFAGAFLYAIAMNTHITKQTQSDLLVACCVVLFTGIFCGTGDLTIGKDWE